MAMFGSTSLLNIYKHTLSFTVRVWICVCECVCVRVHAFLLFLLLIWPPCTVFMCVQVCTAEGDMKA